MRKLSAVFFCTFFTATLVAFAAWANPPPLTAGQDQACVVFANVTAHGPTAMAKAPELVPNAIIVSPSPISAIAVLHRPNGDGNQPLGGDRDALVAGALAGLSLAWEKSVGPAIALTGSKEVTRGYLAAGTRTAG